MTSDAPSFIRLRRASPGRAVPSSDEPSNRPMRHESRARVSSAGSEANARRFTSRISADGGIVAFSSRAANLVPGDRNGVSDVFVHDLLTSRTVRVSVAANGAEGGRPSFVSGIGGDGRVVVFQSSADSLVRADTNRRRDTFVRARAIVPAVDGAPPACSTQGPL
jgi:hypothetical protein